MTDDGKPTDPASLVRFMAAMDAYKDKAVYDSRDDDAMPPEECDGEYKAVIVDFAIGDRVRLIGGDGDEWGFVVKLIVRPGCITYQVTWPESRTITDHYALELEDAG